MPRRSPRKFALGVTAPVPSFGLELRLGGFDDDAATAREQRPRASPAGENYRTDSRQHDAFRARGHGLEVSQETGEAAGILGRGTREGALVDWLIEAIPGTQAERGPCVPVELRALATKD